MIWNRTGLSAWHVETETSSISLRGISSNAISFGRERGEASEPDLMHQQTPIAVGRELLINANVSINTGSDLTVRNLVERAEECFEFSYRGPVIDEQGYIDESRAQARMWLGISQSILGMNSQSFDSPQTQGPGFAFAEAATIFLGLQDFRTLVEFVRRQRGIINLNANSPKF